MFQLNSVFVYLVTSLFTDKHLLNLVIFQQCCKDKGKYNWKLHTMFCLSNLPLVIIITSSVFCCSFWQVATFISQHVMRQHMLPFFSVFESVGLSQVRAGDFSHLSLILVGELYIFNNKHINVKKEPQPAGLFMCNIAQHNLIWDSGMHPGDLSPLSMDPRREI